MIQPLNPKRAEFLLHQLDNTDAKRLKRSLQEVSQLYRAGWFIPGQDKQNLLRNRLNSMLFSRDQKVVRWALNTIAVAGRKELNEEAVIFALEKYKDDPEIIAAAIAALAAISPATIPTLRKKQNLDEEILVLASLQHNTVDASQVQKMKIDIECATSEVLKLALVLVGMSRAPEYLFDPRHGNAAIVKALGSHEDPIVSQYSVWAITENKTLGVRDLGVNIMQLDNYPANVRGWANRLLASDQIYAIGNVGLLQRGSQDPDSKAREGLAIGMRHTCFDGLEEFTIPWLNDEDDHEVRDYIIDHLSTNAHKIDVYGKMVELEYTDSSITAVKRRRIEAMCEGTPLYRQLQKLSVKEQMGTLGLGGTVFQIENVEINVSNNSSRDIKIEGNVQAGTIASGDGAKSQEIHNIANSSKTVTVQRLLHATAQLLEDPGVEPSIRKELAANVAEAGADPTPSKLDKVIKGLSQLASASTSSEKVVASAGKILGHLSDLL